MPLMSRITIASLTWKRHLQRELLNHGITLKQIFLLNQLDREAFLYPSRIAEMLFCDRPTATVVINNMEAQGWITRERDPDDRKRVRVCITAAGREKRAAIAAAGGDNTFDPLACLSTAEQTELEKLMSKLNQHLAQLNEKKEN